jgi:hypothetical protein
VPNIKLSSSAVETKGGGVLQGVTALGRESVKQFVEKIVFGNEIIVAKKFWVNEVASGHGVLQFDV